MKQSNIEIIFDGQENGVKDIREYTLDQALRTAKIGKYQAMLIVLTGLSIMGAVIENLNVSYIMPYAKCDLNLSISERGVLTSVSFLGIVSTSYFWGFLADTWGRQKVLSVSAFSGFILSFASAFITHFYGLVLFRFLAGAMLAGAQASAYSYVSEFHTTDAAPRAVAFASMFLNGVAFFMSIPAIFIIPMEWTWQIYIVDFKPWRLFLICNTLVNLFNGIVFLLLPESPKFLLLINEKEKALDVLRRVYAFNTGQPKESYPVRSIKMNAIGNNLSNTKGFHSIIRLLWSQTKPVFLPPLLTHTWKICFIIFTVFAIGHGTFMWFPDFLVQLQNYEGPPKTLCGIIRAKSGSDDEECKGLDNQNTLSYQILLGVGLFFFTMGILSSIMMKKISPKLIFVASLAVSVISCFALNALTHFYMTVLSFVLFLNCCVMANIALAVGVNLFPINYRGMATSFILMFGRLGGFAGGTIVGALLEYNCSSIFYLHGTLLISCILIFLTIRANDDDGDEPTSNTAIEIK